MPGQDFDLKHIKKINQSTIERYNKRFFEKGPGAYALGWGKKEYQFKRFFDLTHAIEPGDLNGKIVLDIGCGFGDLYHFLRKHGFKLKKYIGIDINQNFIEVAKKRYPECSFAIRDLLIEPYSHPVVDIGVMLGVLNFKQKNHERYVQEFIKNAFAAVKDVLIVNVISDVHNSGYPREPFIYYYNPSKLLAWAQKITPFCSLVQDYVAQPQYEFMLIMRKKPWQKIK